MRKIFFYSKTLKICHFQDFSVNEYFIEISTFWELVERKHDRIIHKKNYIHWMMGETDYFNQVCRIQTAFRTTTTAVWDKSIWDTYNYD